MLKMHLSGGELSDRSGVWGTRPVSRPGLLGAVSAEEERNAGGWAFPEGTKEARRLSATPAFLGDFWWVYKTRSRELRGRVRDVDMGSIMLHQWYGLLK